MSSGQWTVIGLLLFLILLEAGRSANVRSFFKSFYADFKTNTGGTNGK